LSSSQLETLSELQARDLHLLEKKKEIRRFEQDLAQRREAMASCQSRIDALAAERKQLVTSRALSERRISEQQDQVRDRERRAQRVRNDREMRANQDEISVLRTELGSEEEVLLEVMGKIEELEGRIQVVSAELADLEQADHRQVEEASERIEQLRAELAAEQSGRNDIAARLEPAVRKRYELILERRGGLAVVPVEDGFCGGCHMQIPPQALIEIMKTGAIRMCQSCQRILFVTAPEAE
jgi:predicted  nucleic acid-binding Zn-ribbon protein